MPTPSNPFPGAHVLITGAGSGIGAALAAAAAGAGAAAVSVLDRDPAGAARMVASLLGASTSSPGFQAAAFPADVTDEDQARRRERGGEVGALGCGRGPCGERNGVPSRNL